MSQNYNQNHPDYRQRGDRPPWPASTDPASRSRSNSGGPSSSVRQLPRAQPYDQRNEGRELFPVYRNADTGSNRHDGRNNRLMNGGFSDGHARGPATGANSNPLDRRVQQLRNGEPAGPAGAAAPSQDFRYTLGPQRSTSGAGTKRSSDGSSDQRSKASRTSRSDSLGRPKRGDPHDPFRVSRDNCKPGTIIQGLVYEEAMDQKLIDRTMAGESSADTGMYRLGENDEDGFFIRKNRPWIVTAVYADTYTCIPLHTHNGRGLYGKQDIEGLADEFVGIKEYDQDAMSVVCQAPSSQNALYVETLYPGFILLEESSAWLTYTMSRRFHPILGRANVVGKLRHSSVQGLMQLLASFAPHTRPLMENTWRPTDRPSEPPMAGVDRISQIMGYKY